MIAALLVGPSSGLGAAVRVAGTVTEILRGAVGEPRTMVADSAAGNIELATRAVESDVDVLVVLGGDGLAHAAIQACAGTDTALAVIPAGTGNDLARALGMPAHSVAAARLVAAELRAGRLDRVDLGRIAGGAWFGTVLCAGFDAKVNERANRMRWPRGAHRYDLAILAEFARFTSAPLELRTPERTLDLPATMVAVGNSGYYGGGIPICPDAVLDDGLLDVTVVGATRRADLLRVLPGLRHGRHLRHPAVRTLRAKSITLGGDNDWIGYADGERQGSLPLTVTCVPGALRVVRRGVAG